MTPEEQDDDKNVINIADYIEFPKIGFECQICGGNQEIEYLSQHIFPICDECLSDLKEIILEKRQNKKIEAI